MGTLWHNREFIVPQDTLNLPKGGGSIPMHILNNGAIRLGYKMKSTRSQSLKPSVSSGFLAANGGCAQVVFVYKPPPNQKPFSDTDRLTILMMPAPEGTMNWESCGALAENQCRRFVVKLSQEEETESAEDGEH